MTLWTVAHQAPLPMGFSRQEYWSGLPCSSAGNFPYPGIEPTSHISSALAGRFFTASSIWEAQYIPIFKIIITNPQVGGLDSTMSYTEFILNSPGNSETIYDGNWTSQRENTLFLFLWQKVVSYLGVRCPFKLRLLSSHRDWETVSFNVFIAFYVWWGQGQSRDGAEELKQTYPSHSSEGCAVLCLVA